MLTALNLIIPSDYDFHKPPNIERNASETSLCKPVYVYGSSMNHQLVSNVSKDREDNDRREQAIKTTRKCVDASGIQKPFVSQMAHAFCRQSAAYELALKTAWQWH